MAVDWLKIRNDYINGGGSYRVLAEKYGVNKDTIAARAKKEQWVQDIQIPSKLRQPELNDKEKRMVDRVRKLWNNYLSK